MTYVHLPVECFVNSRKHVCDACRVVSHSAELYKDGDFSRSTKTFTHQHYHITHHIILQPSQTTSFPSTPNMVRLLTIVTVLFAGASSVAASYCQCLYEDGSHCCVIVSRHVSLHTQAWLAHNCGISRTTKSMIARKCAWRRLRTLRPPDSATPTGNIPMLASGTPRAARSVRHPTSSKFRNALAPSAKLLRRCSICVIPSEEDLQ